MKLTSIQALQRGVAAHREGKLPESERFYRAILKSLAQLPATYQDLHVIAVAANNLGHVLQHKGHLDAAIVNFRQAIEIKPDYAEAYYNLGNALQHQGNLKASIDCYQQVIRIRPDNADACNALGAARQLDGDLDGAIASYTQALHINPVFAEAYNNIGSALLAKGDAHAAIDSCKRAILLKPDYANAYNTMGHAWFDQDDFQSAIDCYRTALRLMPASAETNNNLGNALRATGKYADAIACFDALDGPAFKAELEANPSKPEFWLNAKAQALECLYMLGRYAELKTRLDVLAMAGDINRRTAAVSAFVSHQLNFENPHPFCSKPLDFLHAGNLSDHVADVPGFIADLMQEGASENLVWEPKHGVTKFGFQTSNTIFQAGTHCAALEKILRKELATYYSRFKPEDCAFMNLWPAEYALKGWFTRMVKHGHQRSHIHPAGWLSGVVYLKTIDAADTDAGAIELGLHGYDLPVLDNSYARKTHRPQPGEILLFPSSLFHKTIPFDTDAERCVIAFDLHRVSN